MSFATHTNGRRAPRRLPHDRVVFPEFSGPTSRVVRRPKDWAEELMLLPHEALRFWDELLLAAIERYAGEAWQTTLLFDFLENYWRPTVHKHMSVEDTILHPRLVKKLGGDVEGLSFLAGAHRVLLAGVDRISDFRPACERHEPRSIHAFKDHMFGIISDLADHYAEEEKIYPGALRAAMSRRDHDRFLDDVVQAYGLDGSKRFLPCVVFAMHRWKGQKGVDDFIATLQPPIVFLLNYFWLPDFWQNQYRPLTALAANIPPPGFTNNIFEDICGFSLSCFSLSL
ncbi:hypothetical protein CTAYLR_010066 [Chrysophaeum taylorii]|uniref:Hemerythrin-like domain-containing protein n=1 Tax=Chrysophaeum taylorii TaxID=2483200 RepID=A0AAD7XGG7_9STRA|nr:hypothetical protein CTAYLR_010066 [Chrysophaeum taylorii]